MIRGTSRELEESKGCSFLSGGQEGGCRKLQVNQLLNSYEGDGANNPGKCLQTY